MLRFTGPILLFCADSGAPLEIPNTQSNSLEINLLGRMLLGNQGPGRRDINPGMSRTIFCARLFASARPHAKGVVLL